MTSGPIEIALADEAATILLGEDVALALRAGDVVCLQGDLGAGKTTLARAIIRAVAGDDDLEVPSPTFTLVQSYELRIPIHHLDLYRLADPAELDELGFDEMAERGAVLVEWPENAGDHLGEAALTVRLDHRGAGRLAEVSGGDEAFARFGGSCRIRAFLEANGKRNAHRRHLQGDASYRAYETVVVGGDELILMNAPRQPAGPALRGSRSYAEIVHRALSVHPFVAMADALRERGFAAPRIEAAELDLGLLLLEHLGTGSFLSPGGHPVEERYLEAARLLAALHGRPWPRRLPVHGGAPHIMPDYDRDAMLTEAELFLDWYVPFATGHQPTDAMRSRFHAAWNAVLDQVEDGEKGLVLRDYHSPNIVWREEREGFDRLGLIDFQDALIGSTAYDLASLAQDARVAIPVGLQDRIVAAYAEARQSGAAFDLARLERDFAVMAAQRNSKILGIFVRLDRSEGKPVYIVHLPRIREYLLRVLAHPVLAPVARLYEEFGFTPQEAA
ncbi:tRNA (adenosine(37)-N6)-threonylcarbamoyltransferase complex ATPase subunit type 1 TsaE [Nitratireductor mangrovi]|uniref:tRNA threonylcarbamoyladenosine biosynthesis protein TsaE n=1 Tax=Nitratireductor mangrovi TaxID=2599600 RepID=A0A5B8KV21_9HYPH|nr:tRNA (adenosine(37)-N6)-threonylcarbamoyltransferase complex ATPase subunit type 1 TsaE [Nitratireductor mangrovi]QDY99506.1 tRNA (adenosine(37)-N6)-threonylcarbamoyltransferase complex ATPase subunit type 1 TsaE [Nitratireductor mangrovi]